MVKTVKCPLCAEIISGADENELLKNGLAHAKAAGHPNPTSEQIEELRKSVRNN